MSENYPVLLGNACIGQACVSRQGLYYQITCSCRLSGEAVCRILVSSGDKEESVGILVPENGKFAVRSRIAASSLGSGVLSFRAVPKLTEINDSFIPIRPDEPFALIACLDEMSLEKRGAVTGLCMNSQNDYSLSMK